MQSAVQLPLVVAQGLSEKHWFKALRAGVGVGAAVSHIPSASLWGLSGLKEGRPSVYVASPCDWKLSLINREGISKFFRALGI